MFIQRSGFCVGGASAAGRPGGSASYYKDVKTSRRQPFFFVDSDLVPVGEDFDLVYRVAIKPRENRSWLKQASTNDVSVNGWSLNQAIS